MVRRLFVGMWLLVSTLVVLPLASDSVAQVSAAGGVGCQPGAEFQLRDLMNGFRAVYGRPALPLSAELNKKAQAWADTMMLENRMHHSSDVAPLSSGISPGWQGIGENVAYNSAGLAAAEIALENSAPHRKNLLGQQSFGDYTEMGVGISRGPNGIIWVTQLFVRRPSPTQLYTTNAYSAATPTSVFETAGGTSALTQPGFTWVQVTGKGGVPAGATVAVVTIEATEATGRGYVQGLGPGTPYGGTSNLNLVSGQAANTAVIPLFADGRLLIYNSVATHLLITVTGYFTRTNGAVSAGRFNPLTPSRLLDTRPDVQLGYTGAKPDAGQTVTLQVTGRGGVPSTGVRAAVLNVVAAQTDEPGDVQVGAAGMPAGDWRNLLISRSGQTVANLVIVPVDANGRVQLYTTGGTHLVVDVQGWVTTATAAASTSGLFVPLIPGRFLDTRAEGAATAGMKIVGVPLRVAQPQCPRAVLGNLTLIPAGPITYGQAGPYGQFTPGAFSSINGDTPFAPIANAALISTGANYSLGVFTPQPAHVIVDLSGYFG